jgi:hypothetical protein
MKIKINRAPVLTLWAAVVAEQLGYDHAAALTLGKVVAGMNAQSKGRRLGIFEESKLPPKEQSARPVGERQLVGLLGRSVTAVKTEHGLRALDKGAPTNPESVQRYLQQKFGDNLAEVLHAMQTLAMSLPTEQLAERAFTLYEQFRPAIPMGKAGWGSAGELDTDQIRALAKSAD